jgi:hypothetical protein
MIIEQFAGGDFDEFLRQEGFVNEELSGDYVRWSFNAVPALACLLAMYLDSLEPIVRRKLLKNFNPFFMAGTAFVSTSSDGLAMASVGLPVDVPPTPPLVVPPSRPEGCNPASHPAPEGGPQSCAGRRYPQTGGLPHPSKGLPPTEFPTLLLLGSDAAPKRLRSEAPAAAPVAMVRG